MLSTCLTIAVLRVRYLKIARQHLKIVRMRTPKSANMVHAQQLTQLPAYDVTAQPLRHVYLPTEASGHWLVTYPTRAP